MGGGVTWTIGGGGVKRDVSALETLGNSPWMLSEGQDVDTRLLSCWAQVGAELHTTGCCNYPAGVGGGGQ